MNNNMESTGQNTEQVLEVKTEQGHWPKMQKERTSIPSHQITHNKQAGFL